MVREGGERTAEPPFCTLSGVVTRKAGEAKMNGCHCCGQLTHQRPAKEFQPVARGAGVSSISEPIHDRRSQNSVVPSLRTRTLNMRLGFQPRSTSGLRDENKRRPPDLTGNGNKTPMVGGD